jgi:hypothetical protein
MERPGKKLASRQGVHAEPGEGNMTALKPLETGRVTGQLASRYPLNMFCAMPECPEPALDPHHIFPRSAIGNDFWFVQAWDSEDQEMFTSPLAHVTGLCRAHHELVESHQAWIRLDEQSLKFIWLERTLEEAQNADGEPEWTPLGPLDPQPGGREKNNKPKRKRFTTDEELRKRRTITVKLPVGVDGVYWRDLLAEAEQVELEQADTPFDKDLGGVSAGKLVIAVLERYVGRAAA